MFFADLCMAYDPSGNNLVMQWVNTVVTAQSNLLYRMFTQPSIEVIERNSNGHLQNENPKRAISNGLVAQHYEERQRSRCESIRRKICFLSCLTQGDVESDCEKEVTEEEANVEDDNELFSELDMFKLIDPDDVPLSLEGNCEQSTSYD